MILFSFRLKAPSCRFLSCQSGQSLVELALLTPLLIAILAVVIDLGALFLSHQTIVSAAHVGVLYGSSSPAAAANATGISNAARAGTTNLAGYSTANPSVTSTVGVDGTYQTVTVVVDYVYTPLFPYPFVPSSYTVSRTATMRVKP